MRLSVLLLTVRPASVLVSVTTLSAECVHLTQGLLFIQLLYVDVAPIGPLGLVLPAFGGLRADRRRPSLALQSFELLVGVPQIVVLRLVSLLRAESGTAGVRLAQILLEELNRRVVGQMLLLLFLQRFSNDSGGLPVIDHLFLVVEELALEARVRVDDTPLRLDVAHGRKQTPVLLLHEIGDDAAGRSRLASVTVSRTKSSVELRFSYQCTKQVPPDLIESLMNLTADGKCFPMFSHGTSITLITLYVISCNTANL